MLNVKEIVWNHDEIRKAIGHDLVYFARCKEPRGWRQIIRNKYGKNLYGKCFRNSLFAALHSDGNLLYCEGYARVNGKWHCHAWVSPKSSLSETRDNWAYDLTWPWKLKGGKTADSLQYIGAQFDASFAYDFIQYVGRIEGMASISVLKYAHYLKSFNNSLI